MRKQVVPEPVPPTWGMQAEHHLQDRLHQGSQGSSASPLSPRLGKVGEPMVLEYRIQLELAVLSFLLRVATHERELEDSLRQSEALAAMAYAAEHDLASIMPTSAR